MKEKIEEIVRNYFEHPVYGIESVPFGLTNLTKILTMNGKKYVIRNENVR